MKICRKVRVMHPRGLHIRPATAIVKYLMPCKSAVHFAHQTATVNAKSVLSLLSLAAAYDSCIQIHAEGEDAEEIVDNLIKLFGDVFKESE